MVKLERDPLFRAGGEGGPTTCPPIFSQDTIQFKRWSDSVNFSMEKLTRSRLQLHSPAAPKHSPEHPTTTLRTALRRLALVTLPTRIAAHANRCEDPTKVMAFVQQATHFGDVSMVSRIVKRHRQNTSGAPMTL